VSDTATQELQTMSLFADAVINELSARQCVPLQHDRLLQLTNGVELPAVVELLPQGSTNG